MTKTVDVSTGSAAISAEDVELAASLEARFGPLIGGTDLRNLLGFRTGDAFRKAVQRRTLPVATFRMPHRRSRFAKTAEVARWLASLHGGLDREEGQEHT